MKKLTGVIFDMDGTLLDTQKVYIPAWEHAGNLQGIKGAGNCVKEICGMNEEGWSKYLEEKYSTLNVAEFKNNVNKYFKENVNIQFKKGALELIDYLREKEVKVAVASGSDKETIKKYMNKLNSLDKFDVIVGGEEIQNGKPAPDIFFLTCERLGENADNCVIFEDSANGVRAAHNAGIKCIGIPDIAEFKQDVKEMLYAELSCFTDAIEVFENEFFN